MKPLRTLLCSLALGSFLYSCGPAAEDRSTMVSRSKQVQDSIANFIRTQMAEAEGPAAQGPPQSLPVQTNAAQPTTTTVLQGTK